MLGKFAHLIAAAAIAAMGSVADAARFSRISRAGQRGVNRLGRCHNPDGSQYINPDRAAKRRRVKAWGGRRQYLKQIKALRRLRKGLQTRPVEAS